MPCLNALIKHVLHGLFVSSLVCVPALATEQAGGTKVVADVAIAQVKLMQVPSQIEVAGTLQARESAVIAAKVTGVVTKVPVVLGSAVKSGDLLVQISAGEIDARLNQAEAQLAQARRNLEREQNLLKKNASTADTVKAMRDQYNMAFGGYNEAKSMLGYTAITAPFDGVITGKEVNSGDLATPGTPLLRIENYRQIQVRSSIPESLVLKIRSGDRLMVRIDTAKALVQGTVVEIAPSADPHSRTAPVVIDIPAHPDLRTGQFARVLLPGEGTKGLLIPAGAVVPSGQMDRVFVVENGRAHLRLVRVGATHDGMVEILAGLSAGETVAISNNRLLENGQQVQVRP